jgi:molecular chaperone DnaJ
MSKDYYKILGISKTASQDEVKAAFRRGAIEHHPDKGGNAEKFKEINEAYQVLGDEGKRKQYDQFGSGFENMNRGGFSGGQNPFGQGFGGFQGGNVNFEDLGDIFGDIFNFGGGGRSTTRRESKGKDIEIDLSVDFMESVFGVDREIELYKNSECDVCNGSGAEPGSKISTCSKCKGNGKIEQIARSFLGAYRTVVTCDACNGSGKKAEKECKKCRGNGITKQSKKIEIKIPAGVSDGETLRLAGQGEAGARGGRSGDLFINLRVRDHKIFARDGFDIYSKVIINFPDATLGMKKDVETVDGQVEVKIPAGIQSGQIMRLTGKGVPFLRRSGRGDHLLEIIVETPKHLSRKQKKLIEELGEEMK